MNTFLVLAFLFFTGSMVGWVLEFFFRRYFAPGKKWCNPGFLVGPWLPIYGFGVCTLYLLAGIEPYILSGSPIIRKILLFLVMAICMTAIEYAAGLIFIIGMKTKLWDYSDEKFNVRGIICLKFSCFWAILGAVYYFLIHPVLTDALRWFADNLQFSFVLGFVFGIFLIDVVYSFNMVAKIRAFAKENDILVRYEELKSTLRKAAEEQKKKHKFLFALRSDIPLREHLTRYLDMLDDLDDELKEKGKQLIERRKKNKKQK